MIGRTPLSAVLAVVTLSAAGGFAEVTTWVVGEGGLSWDSQGLIEAAIDLSEGVVQPSGFTAADNIVGSLSWADVGGTPGDFVTEGQARVWSNVAGKLSGDDLIMVDGVDATSTGDRFKRVGVNQTGRTFTFDLGASFPANLIAFFPSPEGEDDFVRAYEMRINDGRDFDRNGRPNYVRLRRDDLNGEPRVEISFPKQLVRFIELRILAPNPFEIAGLEVFGEGFVPRAQYLSEFIDFDGPINVGALRIEVERIAAAEVEKSASTVILEVRNGTDQTPQIYYEIDPETQSETEVNFATYTNLEQRKRTARYDSKNWSPWSKSLVMSSDGVFDMDLEFLPGPRQFFQFNLSYSGTSDDVMRVRRLEFTFSRPLATTGRAEVALRSDSGAAVAVAPTGEPASFVYGALAEPMAGDIGFDGIRIETPERPEFLSFSMGDLSNEIEPDSVRIDDVGLRVYFPSRRIGGGDSVPIWVAFETTPLLFSTLFRGWLLDTGGDLPQPLDAGDVGPEIGTGSLLLFGSLGKALSRFELSSPLVTPNGDGRNDAVDIDYDLVFLVEEARVKLLIHDLSGRRVKELSAGRQSSGRFTKVWNGRDDGDDLVPPGNYIITISVETQERTLERSKLIAVAY